MANFAKLVTGETYHVQGINFVKNKAVEVDDSLAEYLSHNAQFEVILSESEQDEGGSNENDNDNENENENDNENDNENEQDENEEQEEQEEGPTREELLAEAEELGLTFGKRTSTKNLAKLVEDAKAEKGDE